ncbi:MAG: hypothetical protein M1830_009258 [Pleopsidium flavum]|nr:MAG: hypothetical protein M1830_009258 [Pleopsidium flavum]
MSYHRVLPKPPALSSRKPSESRINGRNALLQHKIMTDIEPNEVSDKGKTSRSSSLNTFSNVAASQRSASLESLQDYQDSPTVETASTRIGQKRAASLIPTSDHRYRDLPSLSTGSAITRSADSASQVCLCQPDPKVPRPRNAFILYRQHYQSAVAAQHPGLANPDISKIIGEQWRQQPAEIKNEWKILAEEEKIRHQQQYPDYRYQPRRNGRNNSTSSSLPSASSSVASDPPKCAKCGGRSMMTPNMSTPLTPTTPFTSGLPPSTPSSSSSAGRFLQLMGTPKVGPPNTRQRAQASQGGMGVLQLASLRDQRDEDAATPLSPDPKRRRFNSNGGFAPVRPIGNGQGTPFPFPQRRRESQPRPGSTSAGQFPMAPPPRPMNGHANSQHQDPSLTLPPLQTTSSSTSFAQGRSVEAMVMTIPHINKIKVLAKISPPLAAPGPTSPAQAARGAVIAIDGQDTDSIRAVVMWLEEFLSKGNEYTVKVFDSPEPIAAKEEEGGNPFVEYFETITAWHRRSEEIVKFITTTTTTASLTPPPPPRTFSPARSPKTISTPPPPPSSSPTPSSSSSSAEKPSPPPVPIALVPRYQLSLSDAFASSIPINDAYAPVDHWQWMATLWRGVVGPDVTIYIKERNVGDADVNEDMASSRLGAGTGVEVRLGDARAIVVRKIGKGVGVGEGALRRVGFEVGEWVRGMGVREEGRGYGGS